MLALLKLVPLKDWLYLSLIVALLGGFASYTIHERHVGEAKIEAAEAKAVTKANDVVAKDDAAAATTESTDAIIYEKAVAVPALGDIGIVCKRASGSVSLPAPDSQQRTDARDAAADSPVGPAYDPSGAALTRAAQADAQIVYLQGRVHELEAQMNGAP